MVTVAVVVAGVLLIVCVIVICVLITVFHLRKNPRQERIEAAIIPMHTTASTPSYNNDGFENPASNNNVYSDVQQPVAPVAGAVGGVGSGNHEEPSAMYESLLDDQQKGPQVQPSFETFKGN